MNNKFGDGSPERKIGDHLFLVEVFQSRFSRASLGRIPLNSTKRAKNIPSFY